MSEAIPITPIELATYAILGYFAVKYVPKIVREVYKTMKPPLTNFLFVPQIKGKKSIALENLV
jgi:hypothetical protein